MKKRKVADNLYVYSRDNGQEYYVFRGTIGGKRIERSIGPVQSIGLRDAKYQVAAFLTQAPEETATDTFGEILPKALADIFSIRRLKTEEQRTAWRVSLEQHALPTLKDMPVAKISREDVCKALSSVWSTYPAMGQHVRQRLEAVFSWAIVHELRSAANPAVWRGNLELLLPRFSLVSKTQHREAPTMGELRYLTRYCLSHPCPVNGCILLIIATACRMNEAAGAMRSEIVGDVWTIPAARQKVDRNGDLRVPLSSLAKAALSMANGEVFFFEGRTPGKHVASAAFRAKISFHCPRPEGEPRVTTHGIRSTFRDWCATHGIPDAEAEKALGHVWGSSVTRAYYRTDLLEQRRALMQRWADALTNEEEP